MKVNKSDIYLDQEENFPGRGNLSEDCVATAQEVRTVVGNDVREEENQSL